MRQNRLAKLVGIDEANLSRIINGVHAPKQKMREDIAAVLGCNAEWLFERTIHESDTARTKIKVGRDLVHHE
jgi:transcriptional regulator with XRE-family HTH domain